jgi:ABC-type multidrug transport system ATPase subunit
MMQVKVGAKLGLPSKAHGVTGLQSNTSPALVRVEHLSFGFETTLLIDLNFEIYQGVSCIVGGESRGKTTLLRLLAGQLPAHSGVILRSGQDPAHPQCFWHPVRNNDWNDLTPREWCTQLQAGFPRMNISRLDAVAERLNLSEHLDKTMFMLSSGSQRKVIWLAAMVSGADLLLMDEPFAALDVASIRALQEMLANWSQPSAWILADYQVPTGVPVQTLIDLGD